MWFTPCRDRTETHHKPEKSSSTDRERQRYVRGLEPKTTSVLTDEEEAEIQRHIAEDPDTWELTDEDWARARPAMEVHPELGGSESLAQARQAERFEQRTKVTVRLDTDIVAHFLRKWKGLADAPERRFAPGHQFISGWWSGGRELNPRQPAWKAGALPLSYPRLSTIMVDSRLRGNDGGFCYPVRSV